MRVAIIGAGIAGLSCAFELNKNGIVPDIFEKNSGVGEGLDYNIILPRVLIRVKCDPLKYLKKDYGLNLDYKNTYRKTVMKSPGKQANIKGNLGYIFKKGRETYSMENQIAAQANVPIQFDSYINAIDIKNDYEHIVIATADRKAALTLGLWTDTYSAYSRIASILGNFNENKCQVWFDAEYAKNSFGYLIPNDCKSATLCLLVNGIADNELEYYWKKFITKEEFKYHIIDTEDIEHNCGILSTNRYDNLYFTGNSGGFTDDVIGAGSFNAIESGVLAARAIVHNLDYNELVKPIREDIVKLHEIRKTLNKYDNKDFDKMVSTIDLPFVKIPIYKNPYFRLTQITDISMRYNEKHPKYM